MNWPQTLKLPSKASHPARYRNASPRIPKYQFTLPPSFPLDLKLSTTRSNHPIVSPNPWPKSNFSRFAATNPRLKTHRSTRNSLSVVHLSNIWWYASFKHVSLYRAHIESNRIGSNTRGLTFVRGLMLAPSLLGVDLCLHASRGWMASPYLHLQVPFPAELDREQP